MMGDVMPRAGMAGKGTHETALDVSSSQADEDAQQGLGDGLCATLCLGIVNVNVRAKVNVHIKVNVEVNVNIKVNVTVEVRVNVNIKVSFTIKVTKSQSQREHRRNIIHDDTN